MPIQTDLSVSPYFDDYQEDKDYYKILFQPSVPVQVRELNQLQTLLQKQIEKFGDHIIKRGSVMNGCQFIHHPAIPYVKLRDATASGNPVNPSDYLGLMVRNSANLVSRVIASNTGFESQDPNLKTLYLDYLNNGNNGQTTTYSSGQTLTIYNSDRRLYKVSIDNASQGFSNNDTLVILSSIEVQNTTGGTTFSNGTFQVGELITQETTNAQGVITSVNTTANSSALVLQIRPVTSQLIIANTSSWSFGRSFGITSNTTGNEGILSGFVGSGATGTFTTTAGGSVSNVQIVQGGSNYFVNPYVTISTTTATSAQVNALNLTADAFLANVVVASVTNSTGYAYGMTVSEGTIYQKGYFMRSAEQFVIIDRYSNSLNAVSVGFTTRETIANSAIDPSLVDNAAGFLNQNAPGANRLKLTPILSVKTDVEAAEDDEFLSLIKFSEGRSYKTDPTQYNVINDELARRTFEESGNYVLDKFNMTTRSPLSIANSDTHFSYVVDPGHAYINGYRIKTDRDYAINVEKGTQTTSLSNTVFDIVYGNYVLVNEFAGLHSFTAGQQISLRDTAANYISNNPGSTPTAVGNEIGKARIRNVVYQGGSDQGTPGAIYRIYLFDIKMNAGKNFVNVRSIFTDNATGVDGVADTILETVASVSGATTGAVLKLPEYNSLIINTGYPLSSVSNVEYQIRTSTENLVVSTSGVFTVQSKVSAVWPYSGTLSSFEENELIIIPEEDIVSNVNVGTDLIAFTPGTSSVNSVLTSNNSSFITTLEAGDFIQVTDSSNTAIARVVSITDDETLVYEPNTAFDDIGTATEMFRCYPQGVPIPMSRRQDANAAVSGTTLTVNIDIDMDATANVTLIANQRLTSTASTSVSKSATRNVFVKINTSNNVAGSAGPWCLGFSDIIRLRKVYITDSNGLDVTNNFYINHKQNENYYDLGELVLNPSSGYTVTPGAVLLVEFDYTTHNQEGVKTVSSYTINDEVALSSLTTDVNTLEIPELTAKNGKYYDLRECLDFRPRSANTVAAATVEASAPVNPPLATESTRFVGSDLLFPVVEGDMFCNLSYYLPRKDMIVLNDDGRFEIINYANRPRETSNRQITLYSANIPPYPSLPKNLSEDVETILKTKMNNTEESVRRNRYGITTSAVDNQSPGYTMEEIEKLEKRISVLEYYANISELEDEVKNTVIPSSVDTTLDRFKFGFFVENFADQSYSDFKNPQYNASIYEFNLHPSRNQYNIDLALTLDSTQFASEYKANYPYNSRTIISQSNATAGPVITPPIPDPEIPVDPEEPVVVPDANTTIANTSIFITNTDTRRDPTNGTIFQDTIFTLSANAESDGNEITIEFNVFSGKDRFEIYQSTEKDSGYSLIYTNETLSPTNLTSARKVELNNLDLQPLIDNPSFFRKDTLANRWNVDPNFSFISQGPNTTYWVKNVGKMSFPYDFSAGRYIKVRVVKGSPYHSYYITFPGDIREYDTEVLVDGGRLPIDLAAKYRTPNLPKYAYNSLWGKVISKPAPTPAAPTITIDTGADKIPETTWTPEVTVTPTPPPNIVSDPTVTINVDKPIQDPVQSIPSNLEKAFNFVYDANWVDTGRAGPDAGELTHGAAATEKLLSSLNNLWKLK
jgi:hypothetical protein